MLQDTGVFHVDQTWWFTEDDLVAGTAITPDELYDEYDEYLDDVSMANCYDVAPDEIYYIAVGLLDVDTESPATTTAKALT